MASQNITSEFDLEELGDITSEASEGETDDLLSNDSEDEVYSDSDDNEFEDFEVNIELDSPQLTPTRSETPVDLSNLELNNYREEWKHQLKYNNHPPQTQLDRISTSIFQISSETFNYPTFVEPQIISNVLYFLNILDLCQLRLVASIFSIPLDPSISEFVKEIIFSLGSIDSVIAELPIVITKGKEFRIAQNAQPNEYFYTGGRSTDPASINDLTSREGSQKWEEDIKLAIGSRASCTDIELYRRRIISTEVISAIVSDPQDFEEAQRQVNSVYSTYPFETQEGNMTTLHFNFLQLLAQTFWIRSVEKLSIWYPSTIYTDILLLFFHPQYLAIRSDPNNRGELYSNGSHLLHPFLDLTSQLLVREDGQGLVGNIAKVQYLEIHNCMLSKVVKDSIKVYQLADQTSLDLSSWNLIECTFENVSVDLDPSDTTLWNLHLFLGQKTRFQKSPYLTKLDLTSVDGFSYDSIVDVIYFHAPHLKHIALRNVNSTRPVKLQLDYQVPVVKTTTSSTTEEISWLSGSLVITEGERKGDLEWCYNKKGNLVNKFSFLTSEQLFSGVEFESIPWEELGKKSTSWSHLKQAGGDSIARSNTTTISYELGLCFNLETLILRGSDDSSVTFPSDIVDTLFELEIQNHKLNKVDIELGIEKQSQARWNDLVEKMKVVNSGILGRGELNEKVEVIEICSVRFGGIWDRD